MFVYILTTILLFASSCNQLRNGDRDGAPSTEVKAILAPNPKPINEAKSRYGNNRTYHVKGKTYHVLRTARNYHKTGIASWYGTKFHGRLTSSREPYNMFAMTAASKELPIPCYVRVRNLANNRTVIVRVNDRGPFKPRRIMDLSYAAAQKLDMLKKGTARVEITHVSGNSSKSQKSHSKLYAMNLGRFQKKQNAQARLKKLQKYSVFKNAYIIKNSERYLVMVGPLNPHQLSIAKRQAKKLRLKPRLS